MKGVHFRPKYTIEQYLVQFSFPAPLDSFPTITVEVESGNADDAERFTGPPIIQDADIFVRVTGGTSGCTYRISCEGTIEGVPVKQVGRISVMPTSADVPGGVLPPLLAESKTTVPYPILLSDDFSRGVVPEDSSLLRTPGLEDFITRGMAPLDGVLKSPLVYLDIPIDDMQVLMQPLDSILRNIVLYYDPPPDLIERGMLPLDGTLKTVVLYYLNFVPDQMTRHLVPLGGILE